MYIQHSEFLEQGTCWAGADTALVRVFTVEPRLPFQVQTPGGSRWRVKQMETRAESLALGFGLAQSRLFRVCGERTSKREISTCVSFSVESNVATLSTRFKVVGGCHRLFMLFFYSFWL